VSEPRARIASAKRRVDQHRRDRALSLPLRRDDTLDLEQFMAMLFKLRTVRL
jgi:hypothetical protein